MNKAVSKNTPIVTTGDVEAWRAEREEMVHLRDNLIRNIAAVDKKLEAAALLSGVSYITIGDTSSMIAPPTEENMAQATKRILGTADRLFSNSEIQAGLRRNDRFRSSLERNPGYYYTMVSRLVKRGEVVKERKRFRLPKKLEAAEEKS